MQSAIDKFRKNIERVRNLGHIYTVLKTQTTGVLDLSDILRAELVLAVSALDHFIHEIVKLGMLEAYHGRRIQTQAFLQFKVALSSALKGIATPQNDAWLENQINTHHGYQSFQQPDKIADAVRLISDALLWEEVANHFRMTAQDVKEKLKLLINRRNQIAHEADIDPSFPGKRWPIDDCMVNDSIKFIESLAEAIYKVVS